MNDQSSYFTNHKQRLYNYLQGMKIDIILTEKGSGIEKSFTSRGLQSHPRRVKDF